MEKNFKEWVEKEKKPHPVVHFLCSGVISWPLLFLMPGSILRSQPALPPVSFTALVLSTHSLIHPFPSILYTFSSWHKLMLDITKGKAKPSPRVSHHYKPLSSSCMPSYFPGRYFSHLSVENLENFIKNKEDGCTNFNNSTHLHNEKVAPYKIRWHTYNL